MSTDIEQKMTFKKSTKNTHVYEASTTLLPQPVATLYISKLTMNTPPKTIKVVVTSDD